jgi:hypothetical protein
LKTPDSRPRRRFFQFSLRSLFALMLLVAVLCGTFGVRTVYVRDQRAVAEHLAEVARRAQDASAGGIARTAIGWEEMPSYLGLPPHAWVRSLMGEDFYRNVVSVSLEYNRQLTDDDLVPVSRLDHLRRLDLDLTAITDKGLEHLGTLPRLESLDIGSTEIGSEGLAYLDGAPDLVSLGLSFTMIDDEGIAHLVATHPRLTRLDLTSTSISDASLASLAGSEHLDTLILCDTDVTSEGIAALGKLRQIRVLALNNTAVDDEAMAVLASLPALEELYLRHSLISDVGIKSLAVAGKLRVLQVCGTNVTDAAMADLAQISTLETLDLRGLEITDAGIAPLAALDLKLLLVQNTLVTPTGLARLADVPTDLEDTLVDVLTKNAVSRRTRTVFGVPPLIDPKVPNMYSVGNVPVNLPRLKLISPIEIDYLKNYNGGSMGKMSWDDVKGSFSGDVRLSGDFSTR